MHAVLNFRQQNSNLTIHVKDPGKCAHSYSTYKTYHIKDTSTSDQ